MTDALAAVSNTRRRGRDLGLSPAIERARASREPKESPPPEVVVKPAPEVVTIASLPPGAIFRIVLDLEGLQEGFADRVEDLDVPLTEIDAVTQMTRGNAQKLLSKSDAKWTRDFGWKSLGKMLKGTGLALALIVDDERFAPFKAEIMRRRWKRRPPPNTEPCAGERKP